MLSAISFVIGVVLLVTGGTLLVRGAKGIALAVGLSPLVVGLTVVALGTSAPELAVSVGSAWRGQADIAVGNVVGSNIANILLVLGMCAACSPLLVNRQLISFDGPIMLLVSVLVWVLALDGQLGGYDGLLLVGAAVTYLWHAVVAGKRREARVRQEAQQASRGIDFRRFALNTGCVAIGLVLLVWGADKVVESAVVIAQALGVSEMVIGLTIVAVGTSLPEVATSVIATVKGERDLAIGNVVGSNILNICFILGASSVASWTGLPVSAQTFWYEIPIMVVVAAMLLPFLYTGREICKAEGRLLLAGYALFLMHTVLSASAPVLWPLVVLVTAIYAVVVVRRIRTGLRTPQGVKSSSVEF